MGNFNYKESSEKAKDYFSFLIHEYHFHITIDENTKSSFHLEYTRNEIRIHLYYDFRENTFYFYIMRGLETQITNGADTINKKLFFDLFEKYDPNLNFKETLPDKNGYEVALKMNADLLKRYGDKVLKGEEWI